MDVLDHPFLTGTATGAILLLAALGLTLTFGQMGVINMANGEFLMAGAYAAYVTQQVISSTGISIVVALPVAFVVAGLLGLLLEVTDPQSDVPAAARHAAGDGRGVPGPPAAAPRTSSAPRATRSRPRAGSTAASTVFGYDWPHRQLVHDRAGGSACSRRSTPC